jgi:hypothetical protein
MIGGLRSQNPEFRIQKLGIQKTGMRELAGRLPISRFGILAPAILLLPLRQVLLS